MGRIEIRDFDGNLEDLRSMARQSWLCEYGSAPWRDLFRPELVRHIFAGVPDPRFLTAAYEGSKLIGFMANLPRQYRLRGKTYQGVVSTMFVTRQGYAGAGAYLISECLRRNAAFGADFALMFFVRGHRPWPLFDRVLGKRVRIERLKTMHAIVHAVDFDKIVYSQSLTAFEVAAIKLLGAHRPIVRPPTPGLVRKYQREDLSRILAMTRRYPDQDSLVRVFDEESLGRQLSSGDVTQTVVYEREGSVHGFINFSTHAMVTRQGGYRWAWVDLLSWEGLSGSEKKALLAGLWEASRARGAIGILEWNKAYYSKMPLYRARFIPWLPLVEARAWILNPDLSLSGVNSVVEEVI